MTTYTCNGNQYAFFQSSTVPFPANMHDGDIFYITGTPYRITMTSVQCNCIETSGCVPPDICNGNYTVQKNGITIGGGNWCTSPTSFDSNKLCVIVTLLNCPDDSMAFQAYYGAVCFPPYNNVYVDSVNGDDLSNCGNDASHPVKTFSKALSILNAGGLDINIHVLNNGADFSVETVTLNFSFNIDLGGFVTLYYLL